MVPFPFPFLPVHLFGLPALSFPQPCSLGQVISYQILYPSLAVCNSPNVALLCADYQVAILLVI
jgi:hypothetical protein